MKTTSLGLSQELRTIGYPQKGEMWWIEFKKDKFDLYDGHTFPARWSGRSCVSPTADELMEVLPPDIKIPNLGNRLCQLHIIKEGDSYTVGYWQENIPGATSANDTTLCDALAKMVIFLKNSDLLNWDKNE